MQHSLKRPRAPAFASSLTCSVNGSALPRRAVKICGVASAADAALVGELSLRELPKDVEVYLGMIVWPGSRRSVSHSACAEIARTARRYGMRPVGVFVDESVADMTRICKQVDIDIVQLHGPKARRAALETSIPAEFETIDVVDVGNSSELQRVPNPRFTIYDAPGGGTGKPFDWDTFQSPSPPFPWLLAGGIRPDNVREAMAKFKPTGIDVSSGVTGDDKVRKDEEKVRRLMREFTRAGKFNQYTFLWMNMHLNVCTDHRITMRCQRKNEMLQHHAFGSDTSLRLVIPLLHRRPAAHTLYCPLA